MAMFDNKMLAFINLLLEHKEPLPIEAISKAMETSKRAVTYVVKKVNDALALERLEPISFRKGAGYFLEDDLREAIEFNLGILEDIKRVLSPEQRIYYIICACMYPQKPVTIQAVGDYCQTSRNTAINDLKLAAQELEPYKLSLQYVQNKGYLVLGEPIKRRAVLFLYIRRLLENYSYHQIDVWNEEEIHDYHNRLREIEKELRTKYTKLTLTTLSVFLSLVKNSGEQYAFGTTDLTNVSNTEELRVVDKYFPEFTAAERIYLTIHLLAYRGGVRKFTRQNEGRNIETYSWAEKIVNRFEKISGVVFTNYGDLVNSIYFHLMLTVYLQKFSVQIINPFIRDIRTNYQAVYRLTERACTDLEKYLEFPVPESELCYLTAHFASALCQESMGSDRVNVLVVCLNGQATSNLLKSEIENIYPNVTVVNVISSVALENYSGRYDCIISTLDLGERWRHIKVHAVLTPEDKNKIMSYFMLNMNKNPYSSQIRQILEVVERFVSPQDFATIKQETARIMKGSMRQKSIGREKSIMDYLTAEKIILSREEMSWRESISEAATPLLQDGTITEEYVSSILTTIETYGSYMVVMPNVAIIHGAAGLGVNRLGISVLLSPKAIDYGKDKSVKLIFFIAIKDKNSHLGMMHDIMNILHTPNFLEKLLTAERSETALGRLKQMIDAAKK